MCKPIFSENDSPACGDAVRVTVHAMDRIDPDAGTWLPSPQESIAIVSRLGTGPLAPATLSRSCTISPPALYRHLAKLERRGMVVRTDGEDWALAQPGDPFARRLVRIARATRTAPTGGHREAG